MSSSATNNPQFIAIFPLSVHHIAIHEQYDALIVFGRIAGRETEDAGREQSNANHENAVSHYELSVSHHEITANVTSAELSGWSK